MIFAEAARRLAGASARTLGWSPDIFWQATPAELAAIADTGAETGGAGGEPLSRNELEHLMERERDG